MIKTLQNFPPRVKIAKFYKRENGKACWEKLRKAKGMEPTVCAIYATDLKHSRDTGRKL